MIRAFTLRALLTRWQRLLMTVLVVAVGVATVTGALVFADTTRGAFQELFSGAEHGTQIVVTGRQRVSGAGAANVAIPDRLVLKLGRVYGVASAWGQIEQPVTIIAADGHPVSGRLTPIGLSTLPKRFGQLTYSSGHAPHGVGQVAIDAATAATQHWHVGDLIRVVTAQPARRFRIAGIAVLGGRPHGGQPFVAFALRAAQKLFAMPGAVNQIAIAAIKGEDVAGLAEQIQGLLPDDLVARSQSGAVALDVQRVAGSFSSLDDGLLAFAIVAVLVGSLIIFNTFTIIAEQRSSERALLRTMGATRGQVTTSALFEAAVIGVLGTALGIVIGPFVALLIRTLFIGAGVGLPSRGVELRDRTAAIGVAVGLGVTLLASLPPAIRAAAASPLQALRLSAGADVPRKRRRWISRVLWVVVSAGPLAGGLIVILTASGDQAARLRDCAIGGALVVGAALIAGGLVVGGVMRIGGLLAAARARLPFVRGRRDPVAELAREHAVQYAGRTALSASSLTIGLALTLLIAVYVGGLRSASSDAIAQTVVGDVAIQAQNGASGIPSTVVRAAVNVPDLEGISSLKTASGTMPRAGAVQVAGIDPTSWGEVYRFEWTAGSDASLEDLSPGQVLVEADTARAAGLRLGSSVVLMTDAGRQFRAKVAGIYRDAGLLKGVAIPIAWFNQLFDQPELRDVFIKLTGAVSEHVALVALDRALSSFPGVVSRNQHQIAAQLRSRVNGVVGLLYALLALSVLMSLLGIGGALNLSVRARASEVGTLRALGMTPTQARSLIRREGMLTALIGGLSGVGLGLVLGVAVTHVLRVEGFSFTFPWEAFIGVVVADLLAGLLATIRPARRVARLDILAAIAEE